MNDAPLPLRLFGVDFAVTVQPERREVIAQQWLWCSPESPVQREIATLTNPGTPSPHADRDPSSAGAPEPASSVIEISRTDDGDDEPDAADYALTTTLTGRAIAARAGELIMLHAGV